MLCRKRCGKRKGGKHATFTVQEGGKRKLRKALSHVRRAAAVLRFKTEKMRFGSVRAENGAPGKGATGDLVALLNVLVRPHVVGHGRGQSVEGKKL